MTENIPSATTVQSADVQDVQKKNPNNKRRSSLLLRDSYFLSAHIAIKFGLSFKYGLVKIFVKHIRFILMLFRNSCALNIGLNLCVAVQTLVALVL